MISTLDTAWAEATIAYYRARHRRTRWHRTADGVRFTAASIIARCRGAR